MNILFLTLADIKNIEEHDIYQDLLRFFKSQGHNIYIATCVEKKEKQNTVQYISQECNILRIQIGNQSNCSLIEKGISTITLKSRYLNAINKYFKHVNFDLILYSTPPVTLASVIKKLKNRYKCRTYLMLKDIFPQNAIDLGMIKENGLIYKYFRQMEKKLYDISDYIGCMSKENAKYLLSHNEILSDKVEICPNALIPRKIEYISKEDIDYTKSLLNIPKNKKVFVYGGNLGKPQGVEFITECLSVLEKDDRIFTIIVGNGSEYKYLEETIKNKSFKNIRLLNKLPREEYFNLLKIADVGFVFLDYRFTIPNFPSRILPYMENSIPIACVVDKTTDVGKIAKNNNFGWYCYSNNILDFKNMIEEIMSSDIKKIGHNARKYLEENYNVEVCYSRIVDKLRK